MLKNPAVDAPIVGVTTEPHLPDAVAALDVALPSDEVSALDEARLGAMALRFVSAMVSKTFHVTAPWSQVPARSAGIPGRDGTDVHRRMSGSKLA